MQQIWNLTWHNLNSIAKDIYFEINTKKTAQREKKPSKRNKPPQFSPLSGVTGSFRSYVYTEEFYNKGVKEQVQA